MTTASFSHNYNSSLSRSPQCFRDVSHARPIRARAARSRQAALRTAPGGPPQTRPARPRHGPPENRIRPSPFRGPGRLGRAWWTKWRSRLGEGPAPTGPLPQVTRGRGSAGTRPVGRRSRAQTRRPCCGPDEHLPAAESQAGLPGRGRAGGHRRRRRLDGVDLGRDSGAARAVHHEEAAVRLPSLASLKRRGRREWRKRQRGESRVGGALQRRIAW